MSNVQLIFQWNRKQEQPNPPQAPTLIDETTFGWLANILCFNVEMPFNSM